MNGGPVELRRTAARAHRTVTGQEPATNCWRKTCVKYAIGHCLRGVLFVHDVLVYLRCEYPDCWLSVLWSGTSLWSLLLI